MLKTFNGEEAWNPKSANLVDMRVYKHKCLNIQSRKLEGSKQY